MKILITGGSGSVGSYTIPRLLEKGHTIRVLDKNPGTLRAMKGVEFIEGGVEERDKVKDAVKDMDAVVHLAWSFSEDPFEIFGVDMMGLLNLLDISVKNKVKHFVFVSSAVVYGSPKRKPIDEEHPCDVEDSRKPLYALAKYTAEKLCLVYQKTHGLPVTNIRFWWGFGDEIGGKHLKNMIQSALDNEVIVRPDLQSFFILHYMGRRGEYGCQCRRFGKRADPAAVRVEGKLLYRGRMGPALQKNGGCSRFQDPVLRRGGEKTAGRGDSLLQRSDVLIVLLSSQ